MPDGFLTVVNSIFLSPDPVSQYAPPEGILLLNNDFPFWWGWSAYDGSGNFADLPQFAAPGPPQSYLPLPGSPTCDAGMPLDMFGPGVGAFQCWMPYTPQPPANLVAAFVPTPTRRIELTWTPSVNQVMEYYVYRSTDPGFPGMADTLPYGMVPGSSASWVDYSVTADVTYYYRVRAYGGWAPQGYEVVSSPTNTASARDANSAPVAQDDAATVAEDGVVVIPALANDTDPNGDEFHIVDAGVPQYGAARLLPDETIEYTPDQHFHGTDSFTYTVRDATNVVASARVTVTVTPVNDPPVAVRDSYSTAEDATLSVPSLGVLANDMDFDGDPLSAIIETWPAHGILGQGSMGAFTYVPNANFSGTDSFSYTAYDFLGLSSSPVTVTITVTPVNDAPVANPKVVTVPEDRLVPVTLSGSDVDGDSLTFAVVQQPAHGTLTGTAPNLTYTPAANYNGPDSFTFKVSDGQVDVRGRDGDDHGDAGERCAGGERTGGDRRRGRGSGR